MTTRDGVFAALGRIALAIASLLLVAVVSIVVASALGAVPVANVQFGSALVTLGLADLPLGRRLAWGGSALLVGVLAVVMLLTAVRSYRDRSIVLRRGRRGGMVGGGSVAVSERSLVALTVYAAERLVGVLEAFARIKLKSRGWRVDIWISLTPRAELPALVDDVRTALQDALRSHTGYPIARLRIWAQLEPLSKSKRVY